MNLLIHDLAAAIERDASSDDPQESRLQAHAEPLTIEVQVPAGHRWLAGGEESRQRRQPRGVTR